VGDASEPADGSLVEHGHRVVVGFHREPAAAPPRRRLAGGGGRHHDGLPTAGQLDVPVAAGDALPGPAIRRKGA
jgi:hypothetical protein